MFGILGRQILVGHFWGVGNFGRFFGEWEVGFLLVENFVGNFRKKKLWLCCLFEDSFSCFCLFRGELDESLERIFVLDDLVGKFLKKILQIL